MKNILPKELKIKFIETLSELGSFTYAEGNPFLIKVESEQFYVFLKNLSPAYFKNSPDVTRVQLPYSDHFLKIFKANIPFIILGYDADNDSFVTWDPNKIKERLNAKSNVSLYSRETAQIGVPDGKFRIGHLTNGDKFVVFSRSSLPAFFQKLNNLFSKDAVIEFPETSNEGNSRAGNDKKLTEITEPTILEQIEPLLKKNRVLESVQLCTEFYEGRYNEMTFKDWFNVVNNLYKNIHD